MIPKERVRTLVGYTELGECFADRSRSVARRLPTGSLAACLPDRGRETGISESGPHESRVVGSVSVRAGTIFFPSQFLLPHTRVSERTTQPDFLFEASCSFSRRPFNHPARALGDVAGSPEMTIYSLEGTVCSPLHAEPAHSESMASSLRMRESQHAVNPRR